MKNYFVLLLAFVMVCCFALPVSAYVLSPEDIYGEPDRGYEEGYRDGVEDSGGSIVYKIKDDPTEKYIADHETRFREFYITFFLSTGLCVVPILIFRYLIKKENYVRCDATLISVIYCLVASVLIGYIMYYIDNLVPCTSVIILSGVACKFILEK